VSKTTPQCTGFADIVGGRQRPQSV